MRIYLGMPVYQGIHPRVVQNLLEFDLRRQKENMELITHFPQSSIIAHSRNIITKTALERDADWLLFWDSDIEVQDKGFLNTMIDAAFKEEACVASLPCSLKADGVNYTRIDGKLYCGTGVMLINLHWLHEHWPSPPWFEIIHNGINFSPEDYNFCKGVYERDGKICLCDIPTVHWGSYGYEYRPKT